MDYCIRTLFLLPGAKEIEKTFPRSLNPKISTIKNLHKKLSCLSHLKDDGISMAITVANLKEKRHDIIHGSENEKVPFEYTEFERLIYNDDGFTHKMVRFTDEDITNLVRSTSALGKALNQHNRRLFEIVRHEYPSEFAD